ncbi:hypothetical protein VB834_20770 [Limnoraphis robusta Tam1]|jgi:hypothetical protein|uniref:Uncharacterized protein n=1 Tax=Limnoraphis robusta CCNP1315 TaxID=3110306 RepID=A0ABU5U4Z8_9CYAN|nr:hypothetical protein [Limnoraphis robusta]MCG5059159.1 hypothetical protein [Limnoraphis sp. WC205]MEA5501483.1 hypothetical protein [Limnoraphis robusta BA-68 BA1]MEA5522266.1 hypothetical protein [Limnoraphis robusta CCNP1315]MEA5541463.1 hypothetical protein [Limnoraphis robusta Tam1]MEA5544425.1 hypothetical protein [Limnoraphis robusta CCNP1324]
MNEDAVKVIKVTRTEFELSDGRIYEHPLPFEPDEVPTVEEFQEFYDHWKNILSFGNGGKASNYG